MGSLSHNPNDPKDERGNTIPRGEGPITKQTEREMRGVPSGDDK